MSSPYENICMGDANTDAICVTYINSKRTGEVDLDSDHHLRQRRGQINQPDS